MASVLRKLITIISTTFLLQPLIQGQYFIYNDNINDNIDLPDLYDSDFSFKTSDAENNNLNFELPDIETFFEKRQLSKPEKTKSAHFCMAIPKSARYFGNDLVEYRPSVIKEYECSKFDRTLYNSNVNGGICLMPEEHCTTREKFKTFLKRERNSSEPLWYSESNKISLGCNCHYLNNGF